MQNLSGWWRLWLVVSVLLAIPTWLVASSHRDISVYEDGMSRARAEQWVKEEGAQADLCDITGVPKVEANADSQAGPYSGSFSCTSDRQYILSFVYALAPGAALAGIAFVMRWVYRGFRPTREQK